MTRSRSRQQKKVRALADKRRTAKVRAMEEEKRKLHEHIEKMLAAYMQETDIPAAAACLVHEVETTKHPDGRTTNQIKYWFEHHGERTKIADTHPDVQYLFDLSHELWKAYNLAEESERMHAIDEGMELLNDFMEKYDKIITNEVETLHDESKQKDV